MKVKCVKCVIAEEQIQEQKNRNNLWLNSKHRQKKEDKTKKERKYKRKVTRGVNNGDSYIYCSCPVLKEFDYEIL